MKKLGMIARWTAVFVVLGFFTMQTIGLLGFGSPDTVLAEASKSENLKKEDKFVVVENEEDGDDHDDRTTRVRNVCALNQSQFDALKSSFSTTTKTKVVDGKTITYAVIKKTKGVNKNAIYNVIGVDRGSDRCKIMKEHNFFFLFLLPGVS